MALFNMFLSRFTRFSRETLRFNSGRARQKTAKRKIGDYGEDIFVKHLVKHKYKILSRNYLKKWGEIDVIAEKDGVTHFFEVKTVRGNERFHNPEDNVHKWKQERLRRAIESYIIEKKIGENAVWQADVGAVFLDPEKKEPTIRITEDIDL